MCIHKQNLCLSEVENGHERKTWVLDNETESATMELSDSLYGKKALEIIAHRLYD